jgi:CxxC-x17-CxxC domain-containing protein
MSFQDKSLTCVDCGQSFVFTVGEQEFYAQKGFQNEPKRCKSCKTTVPFKPTMERPVYCRTCFQQRRGAPPSR